MLINLIKKSQYKEIVYLASGSGVSLILPLLFSPLLARLYSVNEFAIYGFLQSLIVPLSAIACLRYELSIVTAPSSEEATDAVYLSYIVAFIVTGLVFLGFYFFKEPFNNLFSSQLFIHVWKLAPLFIIVQGIYIANNYWLQRVSAYKEIAINKAIQHSSITALSLFLGLLYVSNGLIWGLLIGWIIIDFISLFQLKKLKFKFSRFKSTAIKRYALKNSEYPLFNAIPAFLFYLTINIPTFLIAKNFDNESVGYYTLTKQVLSLPTSMLAGAISQVVFQKISIRKNNKESVIPEFKKYLLLIIPIAFFLIGILLPFGEQLFIFVFGSKWAEAGIYAQILVVSVGIQFVCASFINILVALGKIKLTSIWQTAYFLCISALFFVKVESVNVFLKIYVSLDFISYTIYFILLLTSILSYEKAILKKSHIQC